MSLPDTARSRRIFTIAAFACLVALAGCTVQPLYGNSTPGAPGQTVRADLASVAVAPVSERVSQQVRNHLIFLLSGGAGEPATPQYTVRLSVSVADAAAASIQVGRDDEPTASLVTVTARYVLADSSGATIGQGSRSAQAPYDVSAQQFAALRASRDAQNRAAREAAELVRLAIASDLSRLATR